ncbi:hypothetical protein AAC387_Pa12g1552 [Persea americana]
MGILAYPRVDSSVAYWQSIPPIPIPSRNPYQIGHELEIKSGGKLRNQIINVKVGPTYNSLEKNHTANTARVNDPQGGGTAFRSINIPSIPRILDLRSLSIEALIKELSRKPPPPKIPLQQLKADRDKQVQF